MAVPDRDSAQNTRQSEQIVLNKSQDDKYDVLATELVAENEAGNALIRAKADGSGNLKVNVAAGDVTLNASDIQIGAVELKDDDSDTRMTIGSVTAKTGTVSAGGDTTILSVAGGTYVKLYHISFVPTTSSSTDRDVVLKIGSNSLMGWRTNTNGGGFSHSPKNGLAWFEGADGEDVVLNLSGSDSIRYNITYEIV